MNTYIIPTNLFTHTIHGASWRYYDFGKGKKTLVILLNFLVFPQEWEYLVRKLAKDYRIIIPIYPKISNIHLMVKALYELLDQLNANKITFLGNSIGGIFAQEYVRQYPEKVEKLILLATIAPNKLYGFLALLLYTLGCISPAFLISFFVLAGTRLSLSKNHAHKKNAYPILRRHIMALHTKEYILSLGKCIIDFCFYSPRSFSVLFPMIIIDGQADIVFPFFAQKLHTLYPKAIYSKIEGGRHLVEINKKEELMNILALEPVYQ